MNARKAKKIALLSALSVTLPVLAQAAPKALLEKSASYATGNDFKAYSVPTVDIDGKYKYYDVTVTLTVNDDGTIEPTAGVTSAVSPSITTKKLVAGTYKSTDGATTCTVSNLTLTNGRIQSNLSCVRANVPNFTLSVATGGVTSGHPFLAELVSHGIDKRTDVATQTWGIVTNQYFSVGSCSSGYYNAGVSIGAKTDGKNLMLSVYSNTTPSTFLCSGSFVKQ